MIRLITSCTEPRHVTIDHQCVILDHRGLHFTGRWRRWRSCNFNFTCCHAIQFYSWHVLS